ncbi:MAG TPA: type II toxin-antitoxin system PemK/MazF family toxin [Methylocystis sp.]|nr:type II toxin-antitoxin system PemK/MazF family toxin [Methylocystis sp.]
MPIQRGDVYRVNLEPVVGTEQQGAARPCLVLSLGAFNNKLRAIGVVPLSSSPRPLPPLIVSVPSAGPPTSTALCGQLRTIDKRRLVGAPMGRLSQRDLEQVEKSVRQYFGL